MRKTLEQRENFWIKQLQTLHPKGFNQELNRMSSDHFMNKWSNIQHNCTDSNHIEASWSDHRYNCYDRKMTSNGQNLTSNIAEN